MVFLMLLVPSEVVVASILLLVSLPSPWLSHHGLSSVAVVALAGAALVAAPAVMALMLSSWLRVKLLFSSWLFCYWL